MLTRTDNWRDLIKTDSEAYADYAIEDHIVDEHKKLANIGRKIPLVVDEALGRLVRCNKANVNQKLTPIIGRLIGRGSVLPNFEHTHERDWKCHVEVPTLGYSIFSMVTHDYTKARVVWTLASLDPLQVYPSSSNNLHQRFMPSPRLSELIKEKILIPDEETLAMIEELKKMQVSETDKQEMSDITSEEIEDFLTSIARRMFTTGEQVQISKDGQFTPEIYIELLECLALNPYEAKPVLELLYDELIEFASTTHRRKWGKIIVENSELKLTVNKNAFTITNLDTIDDNRWTTS